MKKTMFGGLSVAAGATGTLCAKTNAANRHKGTATRALPIFVAGKFGMEFIAPP